MYTQARFSTYVILWEFTVILVENLASAPLYRHSHQLAWEEAAPCTLPQSFIGWESGCQHRIMSIQTLAWILSGLAFHSSLHDGMSKCLWPLEFYESVFPSMGSPMLSVHPREEQPLPTSVSLPVNWVRLLLATPLSLFWAFAAVYESAVCN